MKSGGPLEEIRKNMFFILVEQNGDNGVDSRDNYIPVHTIGTRDMDRQGTQDNGRGMELITLKGLVQNSPEVQS